MYSDDKHARMINCKNSTQTIMLFTNLSKPDIIVF